MSRLGLRAGEQGVITVLPVVPGHALADLLTVHPTVASIDVAQHPAITILAFAFHPDLTPKCKVGEGPFGRIAERLAGFRGIDPVQSHFHLLFGRSEERQRVTILYSDHLARQAGLGTGHEERQCHQACE